MEIHLHRFFRHRFENPCEKKYKKIVVTCSHYSASGYLANLRLKQWQKSEAYKGKIHGSATCAHVALGLHISCE